jgi:Response regulator containing a CheY-like receiver domain and an HTH DNA-binding domain
MGKFPARHSGFDRKRNDIARLAVQGFSNKEIGKQLYISENTVKTQLKSNF